ncbi:MAG TPA: AMP-binding protein, partial [Novosphingobium sp.]
MSKESDVWTDPKAATTFPQLIRAAAATYGEAPAVKLTGETIPDETLSFADLDRRSAEIARGLIARGVGKGTRVGFIYGNGPGFATMLAAIARTGAVAIPISTMIRANELVRVLRQSDVSGLILQRKFLNTDYVERLCEALPELREGGRDLRIAKTPYLRWLASTGENLPASFGDLGELIAGGSSVSEDFLRELESEVHPTDQIIEIYTSGSMALPKGVKHNHGPAMFRAHYLRGIIGIEQGNEYPCFLPMFWVGGLMMSLLPNWEAGALTA